MTDTDPPWWRGGVIYQIYPRSFQDSNGDGIGDLPGIIARLPHIAALGVDAVWISPFFTSPMADMGYDVADYRGVDPMFGTLDDFRALVARAHELGLRVLVDQILSHSSDQHPWFVESRRNHTNPRADWYIWADPRPDGTPPNNWLSVFGGPAWEWDGVRRQYYMHAFLASQPDLNLHNREVQAELLAILRFWLDLGVDGFRLDACVHYFHDQKLRDNPPAPKDSHAPDVPETNPYGFQEHLHDKTQPENLPFLQSVRATLDAYGDRVAVGEISDGPRSATTVGLYTSGDDKLHLSYTFDLFGHELTPELFRKPVAEFEAAGAGWICWSLSNHDVARHISRWARPGDDLAALARLSIHILVALRGAICIYQGEELGLTEAEIPFDALQDPYGIRFWPAFKGRDGCRTPMPWKSDAPNAGFSTAKPWLPIPGDHPALAVDRAELTPDSTLAAYRAALALRRAQPALRHGAIAFTTDAPADVLAFTRQYGGTEILCLFNLSRTPLAWEYPAAGEILAAAGFHRDKRKIHLAAFGHALIRRWSMPPAGRG